MKKVFLSFLLIVFLLLVGFTGNYLYKLNKSFDLFAEIIESLSNNYVLDVDPEILVKNGINGMLGSLDPYTNYYDVSDKEELELFTEGTYTGVGIVVSSMDSALTITDIKYDGPAFKAGLKIGDKIMSIDSVYVLDENPDDLRENIVYEEGKEYNYKIIRLKDTLDYLIRQEKIEIENISFADFVDNNIVYVKLDFFTKKTSSDLRNSLKKLSKEKNIEGIILDLRDNPGGLLYSAVEVCELFLPKNTLVVTTKGKTDEDTYYTYSSPLFEDTPLVVIINENSASASEIVAGAIQDNDRGVILGHRSYGKGLVQSIFNLSYGANLKVTTAKYYTPSGRCIQRIKFAEDYDNKIVQDVDTTKFFTKNNRVVKEASGILPDTVIIRKKTSDFINYLKINNIFFNFATFLTKDWQNPNNHLENKQFILREFTDYVKNNNIQYLSEYYNMLDSIENFAAINKYDNKIKENIKKIKLELDNTEHLINENKDEILKSIKIEILRRFYNNDEKFELFLKYDEFYKIAGSILFDKKYGQILGLN